MAPLNCRVRREGAVICVVVTGRLGMASVGALRTTLIKCLADAPAAVIVDLSNADVVELTALSVFPAVRHHVATWPSVPLLLCGVDRSLLPPQSRRLWLNDIPVFDNLRAAKDAAIRPDLLQRRVDAWLPATADAPAQARSLLITACRAWDLEHLLPAAEVIVSELVSNAISHARGAARLAVLRGDRYLHLVVRDKDRRMPAIIAEDDWDSTGEGGRGLRLVKALAASWGAQPMADGKAVWATIALQPARQRARQQG
jgi:anti-sigma regulatory factor (Ser/Thr protein kinase)